MNPAVPAIVRTEGLSRSNIRLALASPAAEEFAAAQARLMTRFSLPVRSIERTLAGSGMRARGFEVGEGRPVLMVHGGGGFSALWAPLMAELPGVRLLAVDRPGCGLSDGFDYHGVDLRRHAVDWVGSVLDSLALDAVPIVANSMGATWCLWYAAEHPERVKSLALLGSPAFILGSSAPLPLRLVATRGLGDLMLAGERPSPGQARRTFGRMGHGPSLGRVPVEIFDAFEAAEGLPTYDSYWSLLRATLRLRGARAGLNLTQSDLARVAQPVQLVWGTRDPFAGTEIGRQSAAAFPHATLEVLDAGHLPWLDEPAGCGEVLREFIG